MFGSVKKLYRNTLFRLSLLGALLFVLSLGVALGYIYYATIESEFRRVDRANEAEIAELQDFYDAAGKDAVDKARLAGVIDPLEPMTSLKAQQIYHQNGEQIVNNLVIARGLPYGDQPYERVYVLRSGALITGNLAPIPVETTGDGASLLPDENVGCLLYTSPSPRDQRGSRMPSSA